MDITLLLALKMQALAPAGKDPLGLINGLLPDQLSLSLARLQG